VHCYGFQRVGPWSAGALCGIEIGCGYRFCRVSNGCLRAFRRLAAAAGCVGAIASALLSTPAKVSRASPSRPRSVPEASELSRLRAEVNLFDQACL